MRVGRQSCPHCDQDEIYISRPQGLREELLILLLLRTVRCRSCEARFYRPLWLRTQSIQPSEGEAWLSGATGNIPLCRSKRETEACSRQLSRCHTRRSSGNNGDYLYSCATQGEQLSRRSQPTKSSCGGWIISGASTSILRTRPVQRAERPTHPLTMASASVRATSSLVASMVSQPPPAVLAFIRATVSVLKPKIGTPRTYCWQELSSFRGSLYQG